MGVDRFFHSFSHFLGTSYGIVSGGIDSLLDIRVQRSHVIRLFLTETCYLIRHQVSDNATIELLYELCYSELFLGYLQLKLYSFFTYLKFLLVHDRSHLFVVRYFVSVHILTYFYLWFLFQGTDVVVYLDFLLVAKLVFFLMFCVEE